MERRPLGKARRLAILREPVCKACREETDAAHRPKQRGVFILCSAGGQVPPCDLRSHRDQAHHAVESSHFVGYGPKQGLAEGCDLVREQRWITIAERARLQQMESDGLLELTSECIRVTEKGRFLIRNVCMAFDRYLPEEITGFSKAI